ncbi:ATP-dependent RNA helicase HrpA [Psychrosphaera aestuarii]|uniref:ATP-dependent RNA helicase HrpA n=1 Tax=Psychrosphaera aestuarii TaxID=1266052 RepID=UPI001B327241|nr:ATP-dependent RNA helicase HrpA [Psychrosphaera aestuarii]
MQSINYSIIDGVLRQDFFKLKSRLRSLTKISDENKRAKLLSSIELAAEKSKALKAKKIANKPAIEYPELLPVSQKQQEIKDAIESNQVVIIAGETGSGKTTQIPKMCLELGRGIEAKIGHTQPRRLAARSVANRLSEELQSELGQAVGYKVRFNDQVSEHSYIKLMTDGVLLAELQHDRYLNQYDTLIIDEAHERSLNIDFILGLLKELLPKRPDLKVIITSATIDPESFSKHFFDAPIISVSGRTYPVEVRYRPLEDVSIDNVVAEQYQDSDQINGIFAAIEELDHEEPGDILLFMNGEREIRDTADALVKRKFRNTEVLPLFARLSAAEQNRIFAQHSQRRIVLATNVAETSLTVPGIKYVIDTGTARISRYSYKTKVQRLPIEPISQASANQRKGRCGRTEPGICIRLYSEEDFNSRPEFTAPEILRTNLASVILQMLSLDLGEIESFPFIQKPDSRFISDGMRLLEELGAISQSKNKLAKRSRNKSRNQSISQLTKIGHQLSRVPLDPRLATMVLSSQSTNVLHEVVIIATALSIQDPRERPSEFKQKSDESHARFKDKDSDFISFLNLWDYLIAQQNNESRSQFRKRCKTEFISYLRVREWQDLVFQIESTLAELGIKTNVKMSKSNTQELAEEFIDNPTVDRNYQEIHIAILSGLLSHIGQKIVREDKKSGDKKPKALGYQGARNSNFHIFPGSNLFKNTPKWVMAAELVETSKLYARYAAKIDSDWISPLAQHLVSRSYAEPYWDKKQGAVMAYETQTLFGLIIVARKRVNFSKIDVEQSQHIFIQNALVYGELGSQTSFLSKNQALIESIKEIENKTRRRDVLKDEPELVEFYKDRLPVDINNRAALLKWIKVNNSELLVAEFKDFALVESSESTVKNFPDFWRQDTLTLPIEYDFEPGQDYADGVSIRIPLALLNQVHYKGFDWNIEPYRYDLIVALIKSLPKTLRRNFVPAPNFAKAVLQRFEEKSVSIDEPLVEVLSLALFRMTGVKIEKEQWQWDSIDSYLKVNFRVVGDKGNIVAQGFDLLELQNKLQGKVKETLKQAVDDDIEQKDVDDWTFGELPTSYVKEQASFKIKAFPALVVRDNKINVELLDNQQKAEHEHLKGVVALLIKTLPSPIKHLQKKLPNKSKLVLYFNPFGQIEALIKDCVKAALEKEVAGRLPRNEAEFFHLQQELGASLNEKVFEVTQKVEKILYVGHQIAKSLKGKVSLDMIQANAYIKAHLESLIYKDFVSESGVDKLEDLLRYIKALEIRQAKLKVDVVKDRQAQIELDKIYEGYDNLVKKLPKGFPIPSDVEDIYWMIEEFKVSLFAQSLGTKFPISSKRIKQAIKDVQQSL